jgi:mevalonate kinase
MYKTFTNQDLLLFAYNDPFLEDKEELQAEITFCDSLNEKVEEIYEMQHELDSAIESVPHDRIKSLLNFSKSLKVDSSKYLSKKIETVLN